MPTAIDHAGNVSTLFWDEVPPCDHLVQIYQNDFAFLDTLEGFVAGGLRSGEGVIVIATSEHLALLERRLLNAGIDPEKAIAADQYIPVIASRALGRFMFRGWPDDLMFTQLVTDLLKRAGAGGRKVRAFGEMVALLWAEGQTAATIRLEHLWHKLCHEKAFSLLCAYPRFGFTDSADISMKHICNAHSKMVEP